MDFSDGFNFTVRLHPVYLAQTDKRECVGAGEMDFSSGVNFTVCLHPACLCQPAREKCVDAGWMDFPAELVLLAACIRFVWRKPARGNALGRAG